MISSLLIVYLVYYANCTNGQLRLTGRSSPLQGRVEICYSNTWFRMCAENYNTYGKSANFCQLLGYSAKGKLISICIDGIVSTHMQMPNHILVHFSIYLLFLCFPMSSLAVLRIKLQ